MPQESFSDPGRVLARPEPSGFLGRVFVTRDPSHRVVVCGGPRSGKTKLATTKFGRSYRIRHADALRFTHLWQDASQEVATWFDEPGPWVVEGVATVRALRKWMRLNPGRPCDSVVYLTPEQELTRVGQRALTRGVETVWREVWPELTRRGVTIHRPENLTR